MKITRISLFSQWQPFRDGSYRCSGGRSADGFLSTIAKLETDSGMTGWGEMAPLGSFYDPAFAAGAQAGMQELAPLLIGLDARGVLAANERMDFALKGHAYAKSALDMACWDLLSRQAQTPLCVALGGRFGERIALYRSISQMSPQDMAALAAKYVAHGYLRLQVKVGLEVRDDIERLEAVRSAVPADIVIFADANGSWRTAQAREFLRATREMEYALEQPCATFEEIRAIRQACDRPLILDESIDGLPALLRAHGEGVVDGVTIKIARVGGITKARLIRDAAVALGIGVTIEDTGGAEICTSAIAHMMQSIPQHGRLHTVDFHNWVTVSHATADFDCREGSFTAPPGSGLGIEVLEERLGEAFFRAD
jgi:L-alanine-DL-glutamate epimerase-like enolase superfamily enzyme